MPEQTKVNDKFKLTIRTPTKEVYSDEADSLFAVTDIGEMEIHSGYASYSGVVTYSPLVVTNGKTNFRFTLNRGLLFFSNTNNEALVLGYEVTEEEQIDFTTVKDYLKFVEHKLKAKADVDSFEYKFLENERLAIVRKMESVE